MQIQATHGRIEEAEDSAIVVNLFQDVNVPGGASGAVDRALGGMITEFLQGGDLKGRFKEAVLFRTGGRIPPERVLVMGHGDQLEFGLDRFRETSAKSPTFLRESGVSSYTTILHGMGIGGVDLTEATEALPKGPTGVGVRLLIQVLRDWDQAS